MVYCVKGCFLWFVARIRALVGIETDTNGFKTQGQIVIARRFPYRSFGSH